ncbi:MAG: CapA family protein [Spirochaetales bacterium]|uniref:CapA family protein n=1 Tax=Candidatus Thalassospirochaeta sargassi TaxID=3119039 RepID=A0AAJ1IAI1_9SPIO|nr:CapA family protein [Spirochaetales bacterium]
MIIIVILLSIIVLYLVLLVLYSLNPFKRPRLTESDLSNKEWFFFFYNYYGAKYLVPTKRSSRNSRYNHRFFMTEAVDSAPKTEENATFCRQQSDDSIVISAVGDIMFRKDFTNGVSPSLWDSVEEDLFDSDFVMGNMEFAVNDNEVIEKTIRFSIRSVIADQLLRPGDKFFDFLSTANNHINDTLSDGVQSSIEYLNERNIYHTGSYYGGMKNPEFPVIEIGGIKTAVLAYTFSTNGINLEEDKDYGLNLVRFNAINEDDYDPSIIHRQIEEAKKQGAELIVAQLHWGVEFEYYPPKRIMERGQDLMEAGIDLIIGHHPHMLNPAQWYKRRDGRRCLCFYSLGNLTSSTLPFPMQNLSLQVKVAVKKNADTGQAEISGAQMRPMFFSRRKRNGNIDHRILPLYEALEAPDKFKLTHAEKAAMVRSRNEYRRYLKQEKGFIYK